MKYGSNRGRCKMTEGQLTDEDLFNQCIDNFYTVASIQGRVSYLFMSIHAVNPAIWHRLTNFDPSHVLFSNMIYGTSIFIFSRPSMRPISVINRLVFSLLGSMMFNYSSMLVFKYVNAKWNHRPVLMTFLGFFCGRMMMLHLLAYLYHVDRISRIDRSTARNPAFDSISDVTLKENGK